MLKTCTEPGCTTWVLGGACLEHEQPQTRVFVRGRPFVRAEGRSAVSSVELAPPDVWAHSGPVRRYARLLSTPEPLRLEALPPVS